MDDPIPNPPQDDFVKSWDAVEFILGHMLTSAPWKNQFFRFIAELRHAGYDRRFRAGQSLEFFILSRARHHGLRRDQASVTFIAYGSMMKMSVDRGCSWILDMPIALTPQVEMALTELLNHPID